MGEGQPRFTLQRGHDLSSNHYNLQLEIDGVLKSWAIPQGPSTDPSEQRLALEVPDHNYDYYDFEGMLEGGYGEGAILAWDHGAFEPTTTDGDGEPVDPVTALNQGHLSFRLEGEKLSGGFALTHTDADRWLLVKKADEDVDARRNPPAPSPHR